VKIVWTWSLVVRWESLLSIVDEKQTSFNFWTIKKKSKKEDYNCKSELTQCGWKLQLVSWWSVNKLCLISFLWHMLPCPKVMSKSYIELQCIVCNPKPSQHFELWILELETTFEVEVQQLAKLQAHHNLPTTTSHMTICTLHNQVFFIKKKSQNHEAHKT
jgi:hypothetical protein